MQSDMVLESDRPRRIPDALFALGHPNARATSEPQAVDWYLPGFSGKARISTTFGDLPMEALRLRDTVRTYSGATARVQLVDKIHLDAELIRQHQSALPIRIPAHSFGPGKPLRDLVVSPGQEICPDAHVAAVFLKARDLRGRFYLDLTQSAGLTYYRFHCGEPAILRVEGIWIRVQP